MPMGWAIVSTGRHPDQKMALVLIETLDPCNRANRGHSRASAC